MLKKSFFLVSLFFAICFSLNAQMTISSPQTFSATTVDVTSDIIITDGGVLTIDPGVVVRFRGDYGIYIEGTGRLLAEGTEADPIRFDADHDGDGIFGEDFNTFSAEAWKGVRIGDTDVFGPMSASADSTIISNSHFYHGKADNAQTYARYGGVIYIRDFSKYRISNNRFETNHADYYAGAICIRADTVDVFGLLLNNQILNNVSDGSAGGVGVYSREAGVECSPLISGNTISGNFAGDQSGGGIEIESFSGLTNPIIVNNIITDNTATYGGGGIKVSSRVGGSITTAIIINNLIANNNVVNYGGGGILISSGAGLAEFFFAHPYSSWERGLSEYTNKLVRQYIPKKSIFNQYCDNEIKEIQHKINRRPRKNLNYDNPKNIFYKFVNKKVAFAG